MNQNQREISQNKRESNQNTRDFEVDSIKDRATINQKLDDLIEDNKEDHLTIMAKQDYTNGKIAEIQKWKERMTGAIIVLQIIVLPILFYLLYERLNKGL